LLKISILLGNTLFYNQIQMQIEEVIEILKREGNPQNLAGMARYGINTEKAFGINLPTLRALAKRIGNNHELALGLWETGYHEARMLAAFIDQPASVTKVQMNKWVRDFNSWDICDQTCSALFDKTPFAYELAHSWSKDEKEYVKRAGFVMMAALAVHDKKSPDEKLLQFLPVIEQESHDDRNFVKKAVNWALRQIGKRSVFLHEHAVNTAQKIAQQDSKSARWIASDALRELNDSKVIFRIRTKKS
jgi:3-methyladenine DNA glycosylase AlkD